MPTFTVPDSSSPPSTPGSRRIDDDIPSTTPAGPPPTTYTQNSFTPMGPPPSFIFGSSQLQSSYPPLSAIPAPNFLSSNFGGTDSGWFGDAHTTSLFGAQGQNAAASPPSKQRTTNTFRVPSSSPPPEDDDAMEEDDLPLVLDPPIVQPRRVPRSQPSPKRSRLGNSMRNSLRQSVLGRRNDGDLPDTNGMAKGLAAAMPGPSLHESDRLILDTERVLAKLFRSNKASIVWDETLSDVANELCTLWEQFAKNAPKKRQSEETPGPGDKQDPLVKASFIANILLKLHHPPTEGNTLSRSRLGRSSVQSHTPAKFRSVPKVLLDWLYKDLDRWSPLTGEDLTDVLNQTNGYSACGAFWEVVFACLFRGKFVTVIELLKGANLAEAACAKDDGFEESGYRGRQLEQAEKAVNRIVSLLESCPAVTAGDWDVKSSEWSVFRHRVRQAREELDAHAKQGGNGNGEGDLFNPNDSMASLRSSVFGISTMSRNSDNRLPPVIAEFLADMLETLTGAHEEVIASASDWVEAVIGIAAWWDGSESGHSGSLAAGQMSMSAQRARQSRPVDVAPILAYQDRLQSSLAFVWNADQNELYHNPSSAVEVALACVFAGDVEGVLTIMQQWSPAIASAIAEFASKGGWLDAGKQRQLKMSSGFDQSDLMVLDYTRSEPLSTTTTKDKILCAYASLLHGKETIASPETSEQHKGWEVAVQILGRLDSDEMRKSKMAEIFSQLPLDDKAEADKLIELCKNFGLPELSQTIADRCADQVRQESDEIGRVIMLYAQAHDKEKLKDMLEILISHCLVRSSAYPPIKDMDKMLKALVTSPKKALANLARKDDEAARLLSHYFSGYATLRRFYDLRDEEVNLKPGERPRHKPFQRRREAANALAALIASADDSIKGGLFDPDVDVVIPVDALLVLLGEALVFLNRKFPSTDDAFAANTFPESSSVFSLDQAFALIHASEDLQTVGSRIRDNCDAVLQSALANYHDGSLPESLSPSKPKQQSRPQQRSAAESNLSNSQFSLVGSSAFSSQELPSTMSTGSEVLVNRPGFTHQSRHAGKGSRGWDWRVGFARSTSGSDVLGVVKMALAQEIAGSWLEDD